MRVILAGIFVFVGMLLPVSLLPSASVSGFRVIPFGLGMGLYICFLCLIAQVVFNVQIGKTRILRNPTIEETEEQGLLTSTDFKATRAFKIHELEDEGPYYFIELEGGSVLFLNGQYLYDYEGDDFLDDEELDGQPRTFQRFPCTDFTIRRHRIEKHVMDILCRGDVIVIEAFDPKELGRLYDDRTIFEDGQIIADRTYDALRQQLSGMHHP